MTAAMFPKIYRERQKQTKNVRQQAKRCVRVGASLTRYFFQLLYILLLRRQVVLRCLRH